MNETKKAGAKMKLFFKQIELDDKYIKRLYFILLFIAQVILFMFNASGIPREKGIFWYELFIEWLVYNRYAYITFCVILLTYILVYILLRRMVYAFIFMESVTFIFGYANKIRYLYTMKYLSIQDLSLINEVLDVQVDYGKGISFFVCCCFIAAAAILCLTILFEKRFCSMAPKKNMIKIFFSGIIIITLFAGIKALTLRNYYYLRFGLLSEYELGAVLVGLESFFDNDGGLTDEESVIAFVEDCKRYFFDNKMLIQQKSEEKPTIIVIMSEAFWNLDYLKGSISYEQNPMERYHEIEEECISGELAVNVYGGQTITTEFEFLTGINVINLPGSMFYYDYITEGAETFVSYLKALGYDEIAIHPGAGYYYSRDDAYINMGFDNFYDMWSFQNKEYYRTYLSDHALTDEIIYRYEEHLQNASTKPLFCFAVSIANHVAQLDLGDNSVVKTDTYEERIEVQIKKDISQGMEKEVREYVNGIWETVDALDQLLQYFEQCDEEVVIVFFGDHAPSFAQDLYEGEDPDCIYKTPYLIWSNFETDEIDFRDFNASYLSAVLMELLHMPSSNRYYVNRYFLENYPMDTKFIKKNNQGTDILKELNNIQSGDEVAQYIEDSLNMKSAAELQIQLEKEIKFWSIEEE